MLFDTLLFHVFFLSFSFLGGGAGGKVNGVWSWQVVHAAGGVHVKLLPCRTEKLAHWLVCPEEGLEVVEATLVHFDQAAICVLCWPSQAWCCSHNQLGCEGGAGWRQCESRVKKDILWVTEIILKYVPLSLRPVLFHPIMSHLIAGIS